jgi:hypothetical protein
MQRVGRQVLDLFVLPTARLKLQDMAAKPANGPKPAGTLYVKSAPAPGEDLLGPSPANASLIDKNSDQYPMILAKDPAAIVRELPRCEAKLWLNGLL